MSEDANKGESVVEGGILDEAEDSGVDDGQESSEGASLLELVLQSDEARPQGARVADLPIRRDGVTIGELVGFDDSGAPLVRYPGHDSVAARAVAMPRQEDIGGQVALMFENGASDKPIVMGPIQNPTPHLDMDGQRLELSAEREITLRCGKASITLTRAGKVLVRGAYVLTRSSGVNRIQGGSVQIN